jgi:hypothetical protein
MLRLSKRHSPSPFPPTLSHWERGSYSVPHEMEARISWVEFKDRPAGTKKRMISRRDAESQGVIHSAPASRREASVCSGCGELHIASQSSLLVPGSKSLPFLKGGQEGFFGRCDKISPVPSLGRRETYLHVFFRILEVNLFCIILVLNSHEEVKDSRSMLPGTIHERGALD